MERKWRYVSFSTVSEDQILTNTMITFDSSVSTKTYNKIRDIFNTYMGNKAEFDAIRTIDKDTYYTYKTVILISVVIALIAATNFMILYRYIISTRKRATAIFKILGLTSGKLNLINFSECIILIVPFFLFRNDTLSICIFAAIKHLFRLYAGCL